MQWIVRTSVLVLIVIGGGLALMPHLALGSSATPSEPTVTASKPTRIGVEVVDPQKLYPASSVEHYLSQRDLLFVRPGLNISIDSVEIPGDLRPVVELSLYDDLMQPLDRLGIDTPGEISLSFILGFYDPTTREHTSYSTRNQTSPITGVTETQAATDSGGTFTDMGGGKVRYRFGTQLPASYDARKTHHLAIYSERVIELEYFEKEYVANVVEDFRPDGGPMTDFWAAVSTETCNRCHYDLALHGGVRKEVGLCVACHTSQSVDPDTGNTVDFKVMIHKIHRGAELPSVQAGMPYQIIGFRQSVHDYSHVEFPQDIRNCTTCHDPSLPGGDNWLFYPSRKACNACHEVNFATGEGHPGGPQANDEFCQACHQPVGDREFAADIKGAHTIPTESETLAGINAEFVDIVGTGPGDNPTVTVRLFNDDGSPIDPASLNRFRFRVAWPNTDFLNDFSEDVDVSRAMVSGDEVIYTLSTPIPEDAHGSGRIAIEFRREVEVDGDVIREAGFNSSLDFAITDSMVMARRTVVEVEKCNACHKKLSLHGGNRFATDYCVTCHRPNNTDADVRPEEDLPPEGISFAWLIHNLHTGEELERDFTVYGFGSSVHNYNELLFPGFRNVCVTCHASGSYLLPLDDGLQPVLTPRDFFSPMQPITGACLGCHSSPEAAAHAFVMSADFGDGVVVEACATCHAQGRDFDVERVHAE